MTRKFNGTVLVDRVKKGDYQSKKKQYRRANKAVSMNNRLFWKYIEKTFGSNSIIHKPRWRRIRALKEVEK